MYLKYFSYKTDQWHLKAIKLNQQTLVVGENATGKTKMQAALFRVIDTILMKPVAPTLEKVFVAAFSFLTSSGKNLYYTISVVDGKIASESLFYDEKDKLAERENGKCSFYGEQNIVLPEKMSVLQAKTDLNKYPEAASVIEWANTSRRISFSSLHPTMVEKTLTIEDMYKSLEVSEISKIVDFLNELDYHFQKFKLYDLGENMQFAYLKEQGVSKEIFAMDMSNGLYRVLYILLYMFYVSKQNVKFITIDDLGEGLDYNRSTKLGKIMFDFCKEHDIQLIASSNDNFLMDTVELNDWLILCREGSEVSGISNFTHPNLFARFKRTGLRNFDIFRTDFIERHKNEG